MPYPARTVVARVCPALTHLRRLLDLSALTLLHHGIVILETSQKGKLVLQFFAVEDREMEVGEWKEEGGILSFFNLVANGVQERLMRAHSELFAAYMVRN